MHVCVAVDLIFIFLRVHTCDYHVCLAAIPSMFWGTELSLTFRGKTGEGRGMHD